MHSLIRLHRNDLRGAREAAEAAAGEQSSGAGPRFRTYWATWAQALLLEAEGELADALATLCDCWDRAPGAGSRSNTRLSVLIWSG